MTSLLDRIRSLSLAGKAAVVLAALVVIAVVFFALLKMEDSVGCRCSTLHYSPPASTEESPVGGSELSIVTTIRTVGGVAGPSTDWKREQTVRRDERIQPGRQADHTQLATVSQSKPFVLGTVARGGK